MNIGTNTEQEVQHLKDVIANPYTADMEKASAWNRLQELERDEYKKLNVQL